jgi:hypothetical protein
MFRVRELEKRDSNSWKIAKAVLRFIWDKQHPKTVENEEEWRH